MDSTTVTHYRYYRDDIVRAIRTLKPLSGGFEVLHIGSHKMVRSVPKELDKDQSALLLLAQVRRLSVAATCDSFFSRKHAT